MGSSSRRKSSRKKSSKLSSQVRKMKRSRKTKSKKLSRRHDSSTNDSMSSPSISSPGNDSYSSNSDDDSMSSVSISTSSSEDTYRRRKNVSRSRGNLKKSRKRAGRRSPSRDLPRMKKRKRSKKNSDSKSRKKSQRKKPRRDTNISSASNDTRSCSTCRGRSDSESEESVRERLRSRSRENKKDRRDLRKDKFRNKMSIRRSRSHSSYSRSRDQSSSVSHSEEKLLNENNSRRLRSVIIFAEKPSVEEENKWEKELRKEEIVYDHDDYPSRSSSGGGSRKESTSHSPIVFDGEKWTENVKFVSNHGNDELSEGVNDAREPYVHDPFVNEVETNNSVKESMKDIPIPDSGSGGDDLEAILRQKALQNLKKFRGCIKNNVKPSANEKNKDDSEVNLLSTSKAELDQDRLPKHAPSTAVGRDVSDGGYTGLAHSRNSKMEVHATGHPVVGISVLRDTSSGGTSSGTGSALNQTTTSVASLDKNLIETENSETELKITQSVSPNINIDQGTACSSVTAEPASCATSGQQNLNNQQGEAKDGSEYQQKTMSVMRGGEMVQVNYKVYIPKRTPALARRQLKR